MIDKILKKYFKTLKKIHQKYQKKKTLQGFRENIYSKNSIYKNFIFLCFLYIKGLNINMANITKETYENNGTEVITDEFDKLWLNEMHVQKKLEHKHFQAVTNKYDKEYKKQRSELNISTNQPHRRFIRADLALRVIMDCRTDESCKF